VRVRDEVYESTNASHSSTWRSGVTAPRDLFIGCIYPLAAIHLGTAVVWQRVKTAGSG